MLPPCAPITINSLFYNKLTGVVSVKNGAPLVPQSHPIK